MAACSTIKAGNWNDPTVWSAGTIPGNGDTVTLNHAVTVTDARTVGHSPGASDPTAAILVNYNGTTQTGKLTITGASASLTVRGDLKLNNALLECLGSGVLEFDASLASSPSASVYLLAVSTANGQASSKLYVRGADNAARFTIRSNNAGGAANARIAYVSGFRGGKHDVQFCNFLRIGSPTSAAIVNTDLTGAGISDPYKLYDCTFTNCGKLACNSTNGSTSQLERVRVRFIDGVDASGRDLDESGSGSLGTGGTRLISQCSFQGVCRLSNPSAYTLSHNYSHVPSSYGDAAWTAFDSNCLRGTASGSPISACGNVSNFYLVKDHATQNPHGIGIGNTTIDAAVTITGAILEHTGDWEDGDLLLANKTTSNRVHSVSNCIVLPNALGYSPGTMHSALGDPTYSISMNHNTFCAGGQAGVHGEMGIRYGETYVGHAGCYTSVQSNLAFAFGPNRAVLFQHVLGLPLTGATRANPCVLTSAGHRLTSGQKVRVASVGGMTELNGNIYTVGGVTANTFELQGVDSTGFGTYTGGGNASLLDGCLASNCDYNAVYNGFNGGTLPLGYRAANPATGLWSGSPGGAHDLGEVNPQFVDCTPSKWRCFPLFDTDYLGNAAGDGAWSNSGADYAVGQVVSNAVPTRWGGRAVNYRCIQAHPRNTANSEPGNGSSWRTYWEFATAYRLREGVPLSSYTPGVPQATVRDLVEWVKAGMAPRNPTLKNAGHDGVTVGAVEAVVASNPAPPMPRRLLLRGSDSGKTRVRNTLGRLR